MPNNNFKVFDESKTNMLSDTEYNSSAARQNGVQQGLASSSLHNKQSYQSSVMVKAIADSIVDAGFDAEDLDVDVLKSSIFSALGNEVETYPVSSDYTVSVGDAVDVENNEIVKKNVLFGSFLAATEDIAFTSRAFDPCLVRVDENTFFVAGISAGDTIYYTFYKKNVTTGQYNFSEIKTIENVDSSSIYDMIMYDDTHVLCFCVSDAYYYSIVLEIDIALETVTLINESTIKYIDANATGSDPIGSSLARVGDNFVILATGTQYRVELMSFSINPTTYAAVYIDREIITSSSTYPTITCLDNRGDDYFSFLVTQESSTERLRELKTINVSSSGNFTAEVVDLSSLNLSFYKPVFVDLRPYGKDAILVLGNSSASNPETSVLIDSNTGQLLDATINVQNSGGIFARFGLEVVGDIIRYYSYYTLYEIKMSNNMTDFETITKESFPNVINDSFSLETNTSFFCNEPTNQLMNIDARSLVSVNMSSQKIVISTNDNMATVSSSGRFNINEDISDIVTDSVSMQKLKDGVYNIDSGNLKKAIIEEWSSGTNALPFKPKLMFSLTDSSYCDSTGSGYIWTGSSGSSNSSINGEIFYVNGVWYWKYNSGNNLSAPVLILG